MFQELMPLLAQRAVILTLSRVDGEEICVNVIPKTLKPDDKDHNTAVTTPLSITGTPQELDQELPRQLVEFVAAHLGLSSTLQSAKEQMEAAAKAARETARKPGTSKSTAASGRAARAETTAETDKSAVDTNAQGPEASNAVAVPATGSLFGAEGSTGV